MNFKKNQEQIGHLIGVWQTNSAWLRLFTV